MKQYRSLPAVRQRKLYDMIEGRGVEQEVGNLLYGLVRMTKPRVCVETGTLVADSAEWIAWALRDNGFGNLVTCDIDETRLEPARRRLAGLPAEVRLSRGLTALSCFDQMDFVHIDSGSPDERLEELMTLDEHNISPGGLVCWHDACFSYERMYEEFSKARDWPHIVFPSVVGFAVFQRPA